jgi:hypothetical protein
MYYVHVCMHYVHVYIYAYDPSPHAHRHTPAGPSTPAAAAAAAALQVAAEALRVCERMAATVRPAPPEPADPALLPLIRGLFDAISARLAAQDQDQEVKEAAILGMAHLVAGLGDALTEEVGVLGLLLLHLSRHLCSEV